MKILLSKLAWPGKLVFWIFVIQWTRVAGQGITHTEHTQLFAWGLSSAASSDAFVMPFLGVSAGENVVFIVHSFQARHLDVLKTELLGGVKTQWILFTVYVAAVENGIHSKTRVKVLYIEREQEVVEVKQRVTMTRGQEAFKSPSQEFQDVHNLAIYF